MERAKAIDLFDKIDLFYPAKETKEEYQVRFNAWYEVLQDYTVEEVDANLMRHVKSSKFPPKLADLIHYNPLPRTVPTAEETLKHFEETKTSNAATPEEIEEAIAELQAILSAKRERDDL